MIDQLRDKKIAVLGNGTNNNNLVQFFDTHNIQYQMIENWTGHDSLVGKLNNFDIVFRTPGLPFLSKAIQEAKAAGVEISSQTKLFFKLCPAVILGVTGTKGKGTTSSLIAKILETAGKKVWLGGNIGRDPFEFLSQVTAEDLVVLELSSFQLQDLDQSPHVAVVVNFGADHLDHHKDLAEYEEAKLNILANQASSDFAILNSALPVAFKNAGAGKKIFFDVELAKGFKTKLLGSHNQENIAAAVTAAKTLGVDNSTIAAAVATFEPLPHRLSTIKEVKGIKFVDDSYSTNAESTSAAIKAFATGIVLILGGAEKGIEWNRLGAEITTNQNVRAVVLIGAVADKIRTALKDYQGKIILGGQTMTEIVKQAADTASQGDVVLLSPGTSSFDMFKNATDRAEQFIEAVNRL